MWAGVETAGADREQWLGRAVDSATVGLSSAVSRAADVGAGAGMHGHVEGRSGATWNVGAEVASGIDSFDGAHQSTIDVHDLAAESQMKA